MKNPSLATYRATTQELMKHVTSIECKVINWRENKLVDSLATLATKSVRKKEKMTLRVKKQPSLIKGRLCLPKDWREPFLKDITQGKDVGSNLSPNMKDFLKINGDLFLKEAKGLLMKCVSRQEGLTQLRRLHHDFCGVKLDVSIYRKL